MAAERLASVPLPPGAINGALSTPVDLARAIAPWGGAALAAGLGSFRMLFVASAVLAGLAAVVALASRPARERPAEAA
jgi:hypothetical protein